MEKKAVRLILSEIHQQMKSVAELSDTLITQAELQSYTEDLYNQLVQIAYEGIAFLKQLEVGQFVTEEIVIARDELIARAERLILDAPDSPQ